MIYTAILLSEFLVLTFLGWFFHFCLHRKWSGQFYRSHQYHHSVLYPPNSFLSEEYREPKKDNSVILFAIVFAPFVIVQLLLTILQVIPLVLGIVMLVEMGIIAFLNNALHDSFHLYKSFWHKFWFFDKLQKLHLIHHQRQNTNYGIFNFWFDRIFRTYKRK